MYVNTADVKSLKTNPRLQTNSAVFWSVAYLKAGVSKQLAFLDRDSEWHPS
jgi:hypothetical protein